MLDPFCGCATTLVAAESLGREWAGIDLSPLAVTLVDQRLRGSHGVFRRSSPERTCQPARTWRPYRTTGRTDTRCTASRRASVPVAGSTSRSATSPSTTWCHGPRADRTTRRTPATLRGV